MSTIQLLSDQDQTHLEIVETQTFDPVGWMYQSIFDDLYARGLVIETKWGHFLISEVGKEALKQKRAFKKDSA